MRLGVLLCAAAVLWPAAAAESQQPLKAICERLCGVWGPEAPSGDIPHYRLELAYDEAAGEIRGVKTSTGWTGGGAASTVKIGFRQDASGEMWFFAEQPGVGKLESIVAVDDDGGLRIVGMAPGKPDLVSVTLLTFPAPDRLHEVLAESGQQYNATISETDYAREK